MTIFYCGLESYESRYTKQLTDWNIREFKKGNVDYHIVRGHEIDQSGEIKSGAVLDAHGRTYYSMTQIAQLVKLIQEGRIGSDDVIFFEDMFTPGIECLSYIFDQVSGRRPEIYVRCLAQTIDPDDFVNKTGMFDWMRHFELMVDHFVDGILVASEEMVSHLRIAGFKAPIYVTGLPFGKEEVLERTGYLHEPLPAFHRRPIQVAWASRWDSEKQPHFFMDLIDKFKHKQPDVRFVICTGNAQVKSNDPTAVKRLESMVERPDSNIILRTGLTKEEYYQTLTESRVLFNSALQDWVSNTLSEADTLGCTTIYPAYRSFPEAFSNNHKHMYVPWSLDDAYNKVTDALNSQVTFAVGLMSDYQNDTISRTIQVLTHRRAALYRRDGLDQDARAYVSQPKY